VFSVCSSGATAVISIACVTSPTVSSMFTPTRSPAFSRMSRWMALRNPAASTSIV
jgi:hypothetical protein